MNNTKHILLLFFSWVWISIYWLQTCIEHNNTTFSKCFLSLSLSLVASIYVEYFVHQEAKDQESGNKKIDHPRSFPACLADCEMSTMMVKIESSTTQAKYSIRIKVCLEIEMPPIVFFFFFLAFKKQRHSDKIAICSSFMYTQEVFFFLSKSVSFCFTSKCLQENLNTALSI